MRQTSYTISNVSIVDGRGTVSAGAQAIVV
jgi:hypothetical protein